MIENKELIVPVEKRVRTEIQQKVDKYFSVNAIVPPISYLQLNHLASEIIKLNHWNTDHLAFVMVCCGNSIWRNIVGTVPFNRRILLLPQCLKNSNSCKAKFDQFGLLCESCGQCSITDYIDDAEKLGYVVLVTDGTSTATRLIESGKIDAVIGVGCMEVLQKIHNSIEKYTVPGLGIPLLTDGCKDTEADWDWIREELHFINQANKFKLLNLKEIQSQVQSIFNKEKLNGMFGVSKDETIEIAVKSILLGGNRYRAFLTALTYLIFAKNTETEILERISLSIECFHKASLIHDDIEDDDFTRYGKDTIHAEYGVPIAINAGDLLIGEGYRLIADSNMKPEIALNCFKLLSNGHKTLAMGQGAELLSISKNKILKLEEILSVFEHKTAAAFKVSLLLGAIAGGADEKSIAVLDKFSRDMGIAYQIMDDIRDFSSRDGDIEKRKFSILVSMLFDQLDLEGKSNLSNSLNFNGFDKIYDLIDKYKIKQEAILLLKSFINRAKSDIDRLPQADLKIALHQILSKMFIEYF